MLDLDHADSFNYSACTIADCDAERVFECAVLENHFPE